MLKPQLQAEKEFHLQDTGWKEGIQLSDFLMQKVKALSQLQASHFREYT